MPLAENDLPSPATSYVHQRDNVVWGLHAG